jgi:hypothetical protein
MTTPRRTADGWDEYRKLVLRELERFEAIVAELRLADTNTKDVLAKDLVQCREQLFLQLEVHARRYNKKLTDTKDKFDAVIVERITHLNNIYTTEINRLIIAHEETVSQLKSLQSDMTRIKTIASVIGAIAGIVVSGAAAAIEVIF